MADIQFIMDHVRKDRRSTIFVGPGLAVMGLVIALVFRVDEKGVLGVVETVIKWLLGGAFFVGGIYGFISDLGPIEKDPGLVALTKTPEQIVWAHVLVTTRNGARTSSVLELYLDDGKHARLPIPLPDSAAERALDVVREVAPRAAIGFSPDREVQFKKDPASLRVS